jgi:hypothetical protein
MKNKSTPCAPQLITGASADLKPGAEASSHGRKWKNTTHTAATMRKPDRALISPVRTKLSS